MGTLETISNNINDKFMSLSESAELIQSLHIDTGSIKKNIASLELKFQLTTVKIWFQYGKLLENAEKNKDKILELFNKYKTCIRSNNFLNRLNDIYSELIKILSKYKTVIERNKLVLRGLNKYIQIYKQANINRKVLYRNTNICTCEGSLETNTSKSEKQCKACGRIVNLYGMTCEEEQYSTNGIRNKHGTYDPVKHFRIWIGRIQAHESKKTIPRILIVNIIKRVREDKLVSKQVTCELIRKYLQILKKSSYNDYIPLIRRMVTGISPPPLTEMEMKQLEIYFKRVINIFNQVKPSNKQNFPYHPYFIYKIIDQVIKKSARKTKILSCIHLQARMTLIANDKIWKKICEKMPSEFKYTSTDPSKYH